MLSIMSERLEQIMQVLKKGYRLAQKKTYMDLSVKV
jgi:hypothetical protein